DVEGPSMSASIRCPSCGRLLRVEESVSSKNRVCPFCGAALASIRTRTSREGTTDRPDDDAEVDPYDRPLPDVRRHPSPWKLRGLALTWGAVGLAGFVILCAALAAQGGTERLITWLWGFAILEAMTVVACIVTVFLVSEGPRNIAHVFALLVMGTGIGLG